VLALSALSWSALATIIAESAVRADDSLCSAGKVAGPQTAGHCCWPGQTWDTQASFCAGKPECPAGTTRDGLTCVGTPTTAPVAEGGAPAAPTANANVALPPLASPEGGAPITNPNAVAADGGVAGSGDAGALPAANADAGSPPPVTTAEPSPPPPPPKGGSKLGGGLLTIGGLLAMGAGYLLSVGTAFIPIGYDGKPFGVCSEGWYFNLVPLFGPILRTSNYPPQYIYSPPSGGAGGPVLNGAPSGAQISVVTNCATQRDLVTALSVTSEIVQIVGVGAAAGGILLLGKSDEPKRASLRLLPFAPGSQAGASLMVVGF
jgi:hypothetical protein